MAARGENVLGVLGLFLVKLAEHSLPQDFREANNGIERSSQFVGHVGEELRLMAVGGLDLSALVLDLPKEPGVLNRQNRLCGESLQEIHDLQLKISRLPSPDR